MQDLLDHFDNFVINDKIITLENDFKRSFNLFYHYLDPGYIIFPRVIIEI